MGKRERSADDQRGRIILEVGNTYERLSQENAPLAKNGNQKIHQWKLYVRVLRGAATDSLPRVVFNLHPTFDPQQYVRTLPPYTTKQTSYGGFTAEIKVTLDDGNTHSIPYKLVLEPGGGKKTETFERRAAPGLRPAPKGGLPDRTFGVELELTVSDATSLDQVANALIARGVRCESYGAPVHSASSAWKIVPDSSLSCNVGQACNTFELVSPPLQGGAGLQALHKVLQILEDFDLAVNASAGVHVHVSVEDLELEAKRKVCQNFVKYEDAFDLLVPPSRRSSNNRFCKSNRRNTAFEGLSNQEANLQIAACASTDQLYHLLNPDQDRYHKLNLQAVAAGRQPTFEFRQHSGSFQYQKVSNWVRLLVSFVENSARLQPPKAFQEARTAEEKLEKLFEWVIKDRFLRDFYRQRAGELAAPCCGGCQQGGTCEAPAGDSCRPCTK